MIYQYNCENHGYVDISKSSNDSGREEFCEICNEKLTRIYTMPETLIKGLIFDHMSNEDRWGYMQDRKRIQKEFKENTAKGIEPSEVKLPHGMPQVMQPVLK